MKRELIKNTIIVAIGKFSTQIISFLLLPLYTSILTTSEYGIYDFLITVAVFLVPMITLLLEESMFRFLIDADSDEDKKKIISHATVFSLISTVIWSLIIFIILFLIDYEFNLIFVLYLIFCIIMSLANSISRGLSKLKLYSISNFICSVVTLVLNVLFIAGFRWGINGLLLSTILANGVTSLFVILKLKVYKFISFKNIDKKFLKEMIKYSIPLVPNNISWTIINLSDRLFITGILGSSANGIYSIANKFPNVMNTLYGFFYTAWKESASKALKVEEHNAYYNSIYKAVRNFLFAVSLGLIVIMPFAFKVLINEAYNEALLYIPILVIAVYYGNLSGFYGGLFVAFKDTKTLGISTIAGAIINILVNVLLINSIGIYAAAISTLVSNYLVNEYRKIKVRKFVSISYKEHLVTDFIMMMAVCVVFYYNNFILNIISLFFTCLYCLYINKDVFRVLLRSFKRS